MRLCPWSLAAPTLAVASGLSLYAAHPPARLWPATFLTVPLLLAAMSVDVATRRDGTRARGARLGLVAGVVAYGPMIFWIVAPAGYLGWSLLTLVQAAYVAGAATLMARWLGRWQIVLVAPAVWVGMDAIRAMFPLSGFSWGEIAYAHVDGSWLLPIARLVGGRGITLAVVLIGVLAFEAARRIASGSGGFEQRFTSARPMVFGLVAALLGSALATIDPPVTTGETAEVIVIQGNDLEDPTLGAYEVDVLVAQQMLALTREALGADSTRPDLIVWPEYSIDLDPRRDATLGAIVADAAQLADGTLAAGMRLRRSPGTFTNTVAAVSETGELVDTYNKRRPVPFGEYIPARPLFEWFPPLDQIPTDAVAGEGPQQLNVGGLTLAVAICFETLFPELIRTNLLAGPEPAQLIVATTSDSSFGRSAEPAQHLAQSQLRAVETGRWVVHASLSGSSAFVDPHGRTHQATPLFTQTWIRADVTLVAGLTPYLRIGDIPGRLGALTTVLLLAASVLGALRRRRGTPGRDQPRTEEAHVV